MTEERKREAIKWLEAQKGQAQYAAQREVKYGGNRAYTEQKVEEVKLIVEIIEKVSEQ
jgi:hypothetical protein